MTLPKFLSPVLVERTGWFYTVDTRGTAQAWKPSESAELAERGQRPKGGVWPDGFGVVELEDIPKPEPLPTAYLKRLRFGGMIWDEHPPIGGEWTLVATVTFDADDNATVTRA